MKVQTVNVVEIIDGNVAEIHSFIDNDDGNKEAEAVFHQILKENGVDVEDIESYIEDGVYRNSQIKGGYVLNLVHSC